MTPCCIVKKCCCDLSDPTDKRLAVASELQKTEDTYLSNIQLLLENYGDPLKYVGCAFLLIKMHNEL